MNRLGCARGGGGYANGRRRDNAEVFKGRISRSGAQRDKRKDHSRVLKL
jgi:hypothetical protein